MQIALNPTSAPAGSFSGNTLAEVAGQPSVTPLTHYQIIRRNGAVVPFAPDKIAIAMMKAFLAVHGTQGAASASGREVVDRGSACRTYNILVAEHRNVAAALIFDPA